MEDRMNQKFFSKMALLVSFLALAVVSCTKKEEASQTGVVGDKIRIGHFAALTGEVATFGQSTRKGVDLAMEQFNAAGGLNGKLVEVITYDDQSKPEEVSAVVTKLITQDRVLALIGEVASRLSLVAADKAMQFKTPMLSPSSTNPAVTQKGEYISRICFIDPFQGEVMAKFAIENLKAKTAVVIRDLKQDYSVGLADYFSKAFVAKGGKILADTSYQSGDSDYRAQLTEVRSKNPDVVFLPGYYGDVALIVRQARRLGIKQPILGGDGWESEDLIKVAGKEALENTYYSNHYAPDTKDPAAQSFIQSFRERYNGETPDAMAALGYDAFNVLMHAMGNAESLSRDAIKDAIAKVKDFPAVTGRITLDEERNAVKSAVVLKFVDGKPTYFSTVDP
jgi:branched-chain amino acid transport system substrate-binding protein